MGLMYLTMETFEATFCTVLKAIEQHTEKALDKDDEKSTDFNQFNQSNTSRGRGFSFVSTLASV